MAVRLPENPVNNSNILYRLFSLWTLKLLRIGWSKDLDISDLYDVLKEDRSELLGEIMEKQWILDLKSNRKRPSLNKIAIKLLWKELCLYITCILLIMTICRVPQAIVIGHFLSYFKKNSSTSFDEAIFYGTALIFTHLGVSFLSTQMLKLREHSGMKLKIAICSLVYRKILRLSRGSLSPIETGKIVNILSNDLNRCENFSQLISAFIVIPLYLIGFCYVLWIVYDWAAMIGFAVIIVLLVVQMGLARIALLLRDKGTDHTDKRMKLMTEIVFGIQVIKTRVLESRFGEFIDKLRRSELTLVRYLNNIHGVIQTIRLSETKIVLLIMLLSVYQLYGDRAINTQKVYVIISHLNVSIGVLAFILGKSFTEFSECLVALRRVESVMSLEEFRSAKPEIMKNEIVSNMKKDIIISLESVNAQWKESNICETISDNDSNSENLDTDDNILLHSNPSKNVLNNLSVNIKTGQLIVITGPMGSGKTSFLNLLLKELIVNTGSIQVNGTISYASQEPWIFPGTLRQNILMGEELNRLRLDDTFSDCDLVIDIEYFSNGEMTKIGEKGSLLSGGQKTRVNLARAIYRKADIYLLDEPLSALNAQVARHIFKECIGRNSRLDRQRATRILITNEMYYIKQADYVLVMEEGCIKWQGSPGDLQSIDVLKFDVVENKLYSRRESKDSAISSLVQENLLQINDENFLDLEGTSKARVKGSLTWSYIKASNDPILLVGVVVLFLSTQIFASVCDYWMAFWLNQEELRYSANESIVQNITDSYQRFFDFNRMWPTIDCFYVNLCILLVYLLIATIRFHYFFKATQKSSHNISRNAYNSLMSTSVHFFHKNPSGRILNRFSKDLGVLDQLLPIIMLLLGQLFVTIVGAICVTLFVCPIVIAPIAVLITLFCIITVIYLRTAMNIKRLEGMSQSPIFTQFSTTLHGLATIRAFDVQDYMLAQFDSYQDVHSACLYGSIGINFIYNLSIDLVNLSLIVCTIYYILFSETDILGVNVGLIITQIFYLTDIAHFAVNESGVFINRLISLERVFEYCNFPPEQIDPKNEMTDWPREGRIEYSNVIYRYSLMEQPILRNINFVINPKENCGIIGRTGAGKTSLIGSIVREGLIEGLVLIDGVDTSMISLAKLRKNITVIPQNPILFSGSLRRNIDPFNEFTDEAIWQAIEVVGLKRFLSGRFNDLADIVDQDYFSAGQKQLFYLVQTLLNKNKIILMDEVNDNIDQKTDTAIRQIIFKNFHDCTVLLVTHRLQSVIQFDRILVIDHGHLVEFGTPYNLLQNRSSYLNHMIQALEPGEMQKLIKMASCKRPH